MVMVALRRVFGPMRWRRCSRNFWGVHVTHVKHRRRAPKPTRLHHNNTTKRHSDFSVGIMNIWYYSLFERKIKISLTIIGEKYVNCHLCIWVKLRWWETFAKGLGFSQFWIIEVALWKISNSDSVRVRSQKFQDFKERWKF